MRSNIPKNSPDDSTPESLAAFFAAHEARMSAEREVSPAAAELAAGWQPKPAPRQDTPLSREAQCYANYGW
jgi:hypothetical protein